MPCLLASPRMRSSCSLSTGASKQRCRAALHVRYMQRLSASRSGRFAYAARSNSEWGQSTACCARGERSAKRSLMQYPVEYRALFGESPSHFVSRFSPEWVAAFTAVMIARPSTQNHRCGAALRAHEACSSRKSSPRHRSGASAHPGQVRPDAGNPGTGR
jgi:hypothetical protein